MGLNYPPGVTGFEYQIGGPRHEWEAEETCPTCDWSGVMHHESHPEFGIMAWCANPDAIETDTDDYGKQVSVFCRNRNGFEIEPGYHEDDAYDGEPLFDDDRRRMG